MGFALESVSTVFAWPLRHFFAAFSIFEAVQVCIIPPQLCATILSQIFPQSVEP